MKLTPRSLVFSLIAMVLVFAGPTVLTSVMDWKAVTGVMALAALAGYLATLMGGLRVGLLATIPLGVASGLAVAFSHNAWLAALLMFVVAGGRGLLAAKGASGPLTLFAISIGFIISQPPDAHPQIAMPAALLVGIFTAASFLWGLLIVMVFSRANKPMNIPGIDVKRAQGYGLISGLMVGVAAWFVVQYNLGHSGGWLMLTIVVVLVPFAKDGLSKAASRAFGTCVGFVLAFGFVSMTDTTWILDLIAAGAMVFALTLLLTNRPYWQYASLLTLSIVILEGGENIIATDEARLWATIIGAAAVLIVTAIAEPFSKKYAIKQGVTQY